MSANAWAPGARGGARGGGGNSKLLQEVTSKLTVTVLEEKKPDPNKQRPFRPLPIPKPRFPSMPVIANHFPVHLNPKSFPERVYHYDVVITPKEMKEGVAVEDSNESTVPDRLLHVIWRAFEEKFHKQLGARIPFDGKKNCYSAKPLNFGNNNAWSDEINMVDPDDDDKRRTYKIQLKLANTVSTASMLTYLRTSRTWEFCELPQEAIQAMDVALRYCPSINYTPWNRSFYSSQGPHSLSDLLELWFGHNQSLLLGRDEKATLNVDMANKAFLKRLPVARIMKMQLKKQDGTMPLTSWRPSEFRIAEDFLKGKLVEYGTGKIVNGRHEKHHRFVAVGVMEHSAISYTFPINGVNISIQQYFEREKGIKLEHPDWPVVHVGNRNMTNYVPMELCEIVPQAYKGKLEAKDTSEMIKGAAKPPKDRFKRIQVSRDNSRYEKCPILKEFGLEVSSSMVQINTAKKLPKPPIVSRNERSQEETKEPVGNEGKFQLGQFFKGAMVPKIAILNVSGKLQGPFRDDIKAFMLHLGKEALKLGMVSTPGHRGPEPVDRMFKNAEYDFVKARIIRGGNNSESAFQKDTNIRLQKFKEKGCQLVIVIMGKDGAEYATVKNEAEVQIGILTQCVKDSTVEKICRNKNNGARQVVINILLKVNAKLGGINFKLGKTITNEFRFETEPILFLGADVTHPAPHSRSPSVAAITASYDLSGVCFQMHIQVQEPAEEVIAGLKDIVAKMCRDFKAKTKFAPSRIIMFRDGVSEGQFPTIKETEYCGMLEGIKSLSPNYNPKVTFLVVKKRHHTRFLPVRASDAVRPKENIPPGTVVDTVITHPTEMEYFLNSHVGIQGTSKPTRYHVIHDDSKFSMDELELLTYSLCYTFVRCTQPVSYPAPTYYAHLAAFRARALLEKEGDNADILTLQDRMMIHPDLHRRYPMFFV